jgi:diguanylate cyclase (GGDEF)-like protein
MAGHVNDRASHRAFRGAPFPRRSQRARALAFQLRLLEELGDAAEVATDWREKLKYILQGSSRFIAPAFAYVALPSEQGSTTIELVWMKTPSRESKRSAEEIVADLFGAVSAAPGKARLDITHTAILNGSDREGGTATFRLLNKTLGCGVADTRGIVGIALFSGKPATAADRVLEKSVLAAIANIVCLADTHKECSRKIEHMATHDSLTGFLNRTALWDILESETARAKRHKYAFSLLVLDLDNFQTINDTYGHGIGDSFLRYFSSMVKSALRRGDLAARCEGDKFAAILPVCDEDQARVVSSRIAHALRNSEFSLPDGSKLAGTVSIGIAVFPAHAQDAKDLYLLADKMLLQAKSFGKDQLSVPRFGDELSSFKTESEKRLLIMKALHGGWIAPYFQPIMDIRGETILGYEVLTRIIAPDRVISAAEFIEVAEDMGVIGRIDCRLMELAFKRVREHGYLGNLFLNVSPVALLADGFMPEVRNIMNKYGIDPTTIVIEITERKTVKNTNMVERFVQEIKREGFRFAIDDFGSGYSSYQYLKTFSIDYLKIDGEFIRRMNEDGPMEKAVVASISALASKLGIQTIAEYVESERILKEVRAVGIDYAQGYHIRVPSPDLS